MGLTESTRGKRTLTGPGRWGETGGVAKGELRDIKIKREKEGDPLEIFTWEKKSFFLSGRAKSVGVQ